MKSSQQAFFAAATTCSFVASGQPNLMLLSIVSANRYTFWNTMLICRIRASSVYPHTSVPPSFTLPESTSQKRATRLQNVVFPEPERPTMAVVVLSGSVTEMSRRIGFFS